MVMTMVMVTMRSRMPVVTLLVTLLVKLAPRARRTQRRSRRSRGRSEDEARGGKLASKDAVIAVEGSGSGGDGESSSDE
jgi:hypothetical protein